ncbi:MAG: D-aminoacyl-tRNA deacylase [Planctomycetota bacterium]
MRAVIQRVSEASVEVDNTIVGSIDSGLLVFLGVEEGDTEADLNYIVRKTAELRIFDDSEGKMNLDISEVSGAVLLIPQFTLCADCRRGRRPSFTAAAPPDRAERLCEQCAERLQDRGIPVEEGSFGEHMSVQLDNDGPVTFVLDSSQEV